MSSGSPTAKASTAVRRNPTAARSMSSIQPKTVNFTTSQAVGSPNAPSTAVPRPPAPPEDPAAAQTAPEGVPPTAPAAVPTTGDATAAASWFAVRPLIAQELSVCGVSGLAPEQSLSIVGVGPTDVSIAADEDENLAASLSPRVMSYTLDGVVAPERFVPLSEQVANGDDAASGASQQPMPHPQSEERLRQLADGAVRSAIGGVNTALVVLGHAATGREAIAFGRGDAATAVAPPPPRPPPALTTSTTAGDEALSAESGGIPDGVVGGATGRSTTSVIPPPASIAQDGLFGAVFHALAVQLERDQRQAGRKTELKASYFDVFNERVRDGLQQAAAATAASPSVAASTTSNDGSAYLGASSTEVPGSPLASSSHIPFIGYPVRYHPFTGAFLDGIGTVAIESPAAVIDFYRLTILGDDTATAGSGAVGSRQRGSPPLPPQGVGRATAAANSGTTAHRIHAGVTTIIAIDIHTSDTTPGAATALDDTSPAAPPRDAFVRVSRLLLVKLAALSSRTPRTAATGGGGGGGKQSGAAPLPVPPLKLSGSTALSTSAAGDESASAFEALVRAGSKHQQQPPPQSSPPKSASNSKDATSVAALSISTRRRGLTATGHPAKGGPADPPRSSGSLASGSNGENAPTTTLVNALLGRAFDSGRTFLLGTASPHLAFTFPTEQVLNLLECHRTFGMKRTVVTNGGPAATVIDTMRDEIRQLKAMLTLVSKAGEGDDSGAASLALLGATGMSLSTREHLEEELLMSEAAIASVQTSASKAAAAYKAQLEVEQRLRAEAERAHETTAQQQAFAQTQLTVEKHKLFAQAFRGAFLNSRKDQMMVQDQREASQKETTMKKELKHNADIIAALKAERERLQFDVARSDREVKRLRSEVAVLTSKLNKATRDNHDQTLQCEQLATQVNLARYEGTVAVHELRSQLISVEKDRDLLRAQLDVRQAEITELKIAVQRTERVTRGAMEDEIQSLRAEVGQERARHQALRNVVDQLRHELEEEQRSKLTIRHELRASAAAIAAIREEADVHRMAYLRRLKKLVDRYAVEREGYLTLLREGRAAVLELRRFEAFLPGQLNKTSIYRASQSSIVAWLQLHGLERYQATFSSHGFNDLLYMSAITEADMVDMKIIAGSRRKILQLSGELSRQLRDVDIHDREATEPSKARTMVDTVCVWLGDFEAAVRAEGEAAADAAEEMVTTGPVPPQQSSPSPSAASA